MILGVFFGLILGIAISILILIGQAILYKKGITIDTPIQKISKKEVMLINPKKDRAIKNIINNI